jgi:hypothetical protein
MPRQPAAVLPASVLFFLASTEKVLRNPKLREEKLYWYGRSDVLY